VLLNPTFPTEAFERDRKRALIGLKAEKQDPSTIANKKFMQALYKDHPYAHSPSGDENSINALSQADLLDFHKQYYVGNNAIMVIVGDITLLDAKNLANKIIGKLPDGKKAPALAKVKSLTKSSKVNTEFPSSQTHIFIGQPGSKRSDPDYFALYVGNHILGGSGLISKISEEIREKRGLAYSSYSYFSPMREPGPFTIGLQTKNSSKAESLKVIKNILNDFIKNGPSAEELKHAKQNIIGGFPLRLDSNKKISQYVAMIGFYELPLDYLSAFSSKIEAISLDNIKDAWQRRIIPEKMVTITVGKQDS
jgi:zinc protease